MLTQLRRAVLGAFVVLTLIVAIAVAGLLTPVSTQAQSSAGIVLETRYYQTLDRWVMRGGLVDEVKAIVAPTCGKLVILTASAPEKLAFTATQREEYDFRVSVCVKMIVNRVHAQPEFHDPKIVKMLRESTTPLFVELRRRYLPDTVGASSQQSPAAGAQEQILSKADADMIFALTRADWEKYARQVVPPEGWDMRLLPHGTGTSLARFNRATGMGAFSRPRIWMDTSLEEMMLLRGGGHGETQAR